MGSAGELVVISGPSGAGKTSVCRALKEFPRVSFSVSATTRPQRPGEEDGRDYHFLSSKDFVSRMAAGEFLESASYNGHFYGTLRRPMEQALLDGQVFVLEIEVQGTRQLRDAAVDGKFVFVIPPDLDVLRQRLQNRGTDSPEEIEQRIAIATEELKSADLYDHVVVNEDLDRTIAAVADIIGL
jgi:guanylate kinase